MKTALFLIFFIAPLFLFTQTREEKEKAMEYGLEAIRLMDEEGEFEEARDLLEEAQDLDPDNPSYPYEIAYAYYNEKDYDEAIDILEELIEDYKPEDIYYQLMGNAYDYKGEPEKAMEVYAEGVEKFPNSGKLFLEQGVLKLRQEKYDEAISFWEKGVKAEPTHSSNYYWLAKIFCGSTEEMWGVIYGEIFINIERGTRRTQEISKLLYDTYKSEITIEKDTMVLVSFAKNFMPNINNEDGEMPFALVFEPTLAMSISMNIPEKINLNSLNDIRNSFIDIYYQREFDESHPNVIFEWHKELIDREYFEAYNYWLFSQGDKSQFQEWLSSNKENYEEFMEWFTENPLMVNEINYFHRFNY